MRTPWIWMALAIGCDKYTFEPPVDTDPVVSVTTGETGLGPGERDLTGNFGWITLGRRLANVDVGQQYYARAYVFSGDPGVVNLPGCVWEGHTCTTAYPAAGERLTGVPIPSTVPGSVSAGDDFVAMSTILVRNTPQGAVPFYQGVPTAVQAPGDLTLDGDLAPFTSTDAFAVAGPLFPLAPPGDARISAASGDTVTFQWTPGGVGDVILEVGTTIIGLPDTGEYVLDTASLGLSAPVDVARTTLSRMTLTEVDAAGNTFWVQTRSDQSWWLDYLDTKGWTELTDPQYISGTCAGAKAVAPTGSGQYFGTLAPYGNDVELANGNSGTGYPTPGRDGFLKLILTKGDALEVVFSQPLTDEAVYLLNSDCNAAAPLAGADLSYTEAETMQYTAPADEVVYLALDGYDPGTGELFSVVISGI